MTDSARAILTQALIIEVRDSAGGLAPAGTVIEFTSVIAPGNIPEAYTRSPGTIEFVATGSATTDAGGRATKVVRLGSKAGSARIAVSVPTLNLRDTVRYTVTPGNAAMISIAPADTGVYVNGSFALRGGVVDANGNVRSDPVTWSVSAAGISVGNSGVVSASAIGRYTITGTASTFTGNSAVSVVPPAKVAAWRLSGGAGNIVSLELDGSNLKTLAPVTDGGVGAHPTWMAGSDKIIYTFFNGTHQMLRIVDQNGVVAPFFASPPVNVSHQAEPWPSSNGEWVYFSAYDSDYSEFFYTLYRSKSDATAPQRLGSMVGPNMVTRHPSPSPDGSKVAFMSAVSSQIVVRVLDVATQSVSSWSVVGDNPSWSPDGTTIAYISNDNRVKVVNPDGSGDRFLTAAATFLYAPRQPAWVSDSKWLVARNDDGVYDLINVTSGLVVPLPYLGPLSMLSLK